MRNRKEFRKVSLKDEKNCLIFPFPVEKEHKFLIKVNEKMSSFYIFAIQNNFLISPDVSKIYLARTETHSDGNTVIYSFIEDKLNFELLINAQQDPKKALVINSLLNTKIIAVLKDLPNAQNELKTSFAKQLRCSTCQKLGILNPELKVLINMIV